MDKNETITEFSSEDIIFLAKGVLPIFTKYKLESIVEIFLKVFK